MAINFQPSFFYNMVDPIEFYNIKLRRSIILTISKVIKETPSKRLDENVRLFVSQHERSKMH